MTIHTDTIAELRVKKDEFWRLMLASEKHEAWHRAQAQKWLDKWMAADKAQWPLICKELEIDG